MRSTLYTIFLAAFLAGCVSTHTPIAPPVNPGFMVQINQHFNSLPNYTRIYFQDGRQLPFKALDRWLTYCRLHIYNPDKEADYTTSVSPGYFKVEWVRNRYEITRNSTGASNIYASAGFGLSIFSSSPGVFWERDGPPSYYLYRVEMKLTSPDQPDVQRLICSRKWGTRGNYFPTLGEIRKALGGIVEIIPSSISSNT